MIITSIVIVFFLLGSQVNGGKKGKHPNKMNVPKPGPIYQGDLAGEEEFKYIVGISRLGYYPHGGGTILNEYWILTCRHNILKENRPDISPRLYFNYTDRGPLSVWPKYYSDYNKTILLDLPLKDPERSFCMDVPPADVVYPQDDDLALIKLQTPLDLSDTSPYLLKKIDLHVGDMFKDFKRGYDVRLAGWGRLDYSQPDAQVTSDLRKTSMPNEEREKDKDLNPLIYSDYRPEKHLPLRFKKSACIGDSGGPIVLQTIETREEDLMGVQVFITEPYCLNFTFAMNLGYQPYRDWIDNVIQNEPEEYLCSNLINKEYNIDWKPPPPPQESLSTANSKLT